MSSYLIAGGNLLDATGAPIKPNTSVFVVGNKIEFTGTAAEAVSFAEAQGPHEVIDASGKTVMPRSEEHTSELQSLMRISYAVYSLKKQQKHQNTSQHLPTTIT